MANIFSKIIQKLSIRSRGEAEQSKKKENTIVLWDNKMSAKEKIKFYTPFNDLCDLPAQAAKNVVDSASDTFKKYLDSDNYEGYSDKLCNYIQELHELRVELDKSRSELNKYRNGKDNNLKVLNNLKDKVRLDIDKYETCVSNIWQDMGIDLATAEAYFNKLTNNVEPVENIDKRVAYL